MSSEVRELQLEDYRKSRFLVAALLGMTISRGGITALTPPPLLPHRLRFAEVR